MNQKKTSLFFHFFKVYEIRYEYFDTLSLIPIFKKKFFLFLNGILGMGSKYKKTSAKYSRQGQGLLCTRGPWGLDTRQYRRLIEILSIYHSVNYMIPPWRLSVYYSPWGV